MPKTLFEKVWERHLVRPESDEAPAVLYIDLHLIHEVTSPQAFDELRRRSLKVRRPGRTLATMDHSTPTAWPAGSSPLAVINDQAASQIMQLSANCNEFGITLHDFDSLSRGIVHVIGPELGATQPGKTIVCGDSHTSTHGAFGALAFGIGSSEVGHVLATQCLLQRKPKTMAIEVSGELQQGVGAKDLILAIIAKIGVGGGTGHVLEYRGPAVEKLSMEGRMTVCNMSIEAGARAGMIAPDQTTFDYVKGKPMAPQGADWDAALAHWKTLKTDEGAQFDTVVHIDGSAIEPMVTYGTHPGMGMPITGDVPQAADASDERALDYMGLTSGTAIQEQKIQTAFIGSCTNSRISDLREAAGVLAGRQVDPSVRLLVVPGSQSIKAQAEQEGLHEVFKAAGADWRESGCSMCIAMNGDAVNAGDYAISTSNRNFEGRQGKGARTMLASPATVAASAIEGRVTDPRPYINAAQEAKVPA